MDRRTLAPTLLGALALSVVAVLGTAGSTSGRSLETAQFGGAITKDEPQTIELPAAKDNTLHESDAGDRSNGKGANFFVGNTNESVIRRAVLEFDVAAAIPAGAEIDSVTLSLNMSKTSSGAQSVQLHRLTREWGEGDSDAGGNEGGGAPAAPGDATWLHSEYPNAMWSAAGGDFALSASASTTVDAPGRYEWSSSDMADEVEAWLADPESNHGWILIGAERGHDGTKLHRTSKRFDSKDNPHADLLPKLIVEYRVDDTTSTPGTETPETSTPETSTPETSTPETSTPETSTPETSTPETATPETSTPETSTPETSTPETSTPGTPTTETPTAETPTPTAWRAFLPMAWKEPPSR